MLKKIFFSILFISAVSIHGMDQDDKSAHKKRKKRIPSILRLIHIHNKSKKIKDLKPSQNEPVNPLFDHNILGYITHKIITLNSHDLTECRTNIRQLSRTNSILYKYYTSEKIGQYIIKSMTLYNDHSERYLAEWFGYKKIKDKISDLIYKSEHLNENFTDNDLQDRWYLNITYRKSIASNEKFTLLLTAIANMDAKKTSILLGAGADCNDNRCINPIIMLTGQSIIFYNYKMLCEKTQKKYFAIINLLLEKKMNPDARYQPTDPTLLHRAACNGDKVFAHLLLKNGANPYKLYIDFHYSYNCSLESLKAFENHSKKYSIDTLYTKTDNHTKPWKYNAFLLEASEPKGWLKIMYDEMQTLKHN